MKDLVISFKRLKLYANKKDSEKILCKTVSSQAYFRGTWWSSTPGGLRKMFSYSMTNFSVIGAHTVLV